MKTLLFALLLPAAAWASTPPSPNRIGVLLIAMDRGAEAAATALESRMEKALGEIPGANVRRTEDLFGMPPDEGAKASLDRAERGFLESEKAFASKDAQDAERKLRATVLEYQTAAGALKECGNYCESLVMYASILHKRGETDLATRALLDLLALNPTQEFDPKLLGKELIAFRAQVATSRIALLRGSAVVKSRPAGARVYLDGELKGHSPLTLGPLPAGKHLLRVERPGFKQVGQLIEIGEEELEIQVDLQPTEAWKSWDAQMDKAVQDAARGGGEGLVQAGKRFSLDRAILGTVKQLDELGSTELVVGLFDLRSGKRLSHRRVVYQGDEFGQLDNEVKRLVNHLFGQAQAPKQVTKTRDPLDKRSGLEEWGGDGQKRAPPTKKKGDPLKGVDGMEDW